MAPIALTVAMLGMLLLYALHVIPPEPPGDEGIMAHAFQAWAVLEVAAIAAFSFRWLPRSPGVAWKVAAVQTVAAMVPFAIVWRLGY